MLVKSERHVDDDSHERTVGLVGVRNSCMVRVPFEQKEEGSIADIAEILPRLGKRWKG